MATRFWVRNKPQITIQILVISTLLSQAIHATSLHIPGSYLGKEIQINRRQDSDDDEDMDSNASAPYQDDNRSTNSDEYGENDPDGPYGETPREEEGQADLERFFDDHLGASEKDGMDKENLPSNLIEYISTSPQQLPQARRPIIYDLPELPSPTVVAHPLSAQASVPIARYSNHHDGRSNVEMRYFRLPNNRLFIIQHRENGLKNDPEPMEAQNKKLTPDGDQALDARGSEIIATEDDDMDRVYVTNAINKPFRIDDLGGYDPEEDFRDASRDIEDGPKLKRKATGKRANLNNPPVKDISFNDGETDTMFNDASETDEITFAQDDPYQTDLEAEMRDSAFDRPTQSLPKSKKYQGEPDKKNGQRIVYINLRRMDSDDESEGNWINDGVDDMDVPSQSHQDKVLDRAANKESAARVDDGNDNGTGEIVEDQNAPVEQPIDTDNQRMSNAKYLEKHNEPEDRDDNEGY